MNYKSVQDMIAAGKTNMITLLNNVAYDDNAYTITNIPSWVKFNGHTSSTMQASGNSWLGFGNYGEQFKFNRRDAKMFYLWYETGTIFNYIKFMKIRWRGYSQYNSAYWQEWETVWFDTGDVMIHAVEIPAAYYNGSFNIIAGGATTITYSYNALTAASPYVTFYSQDEENTTFQIAYELANIRVPWHDKWLIENEGVYYNIIDGELNPLEITEITAQNMIDYGMDDAPSGALLLNMSAPKLHRWNDSEQYVEVPLQPVITAHIAALPYEQVMECHIDMSDTTIKGIEKVTALYSGITQICYSLDDGDTYTQYMPMTDFLDLDFAEIYRLLPNSKILRLRFYFQENDVLTRQTITYIN